ARDPGAVPVPVDGVQSVDARANGAARARAGARLAVRGAEELRALAAVGGSGGVQRGSKEVFDLTPLPPLPFEGRGESYGPMRPCPPRAGAHRSIPWARISYGLAWVVLPCPVEGVSQWGLTIRGALARRSGWRGP